MTQFLSVKMWDLNMGSPARKGSEVLSYPILSFFSVLLHSLSYLFCPSLFYFMLNPLLSSPDTVTVNTDTPTGIDGQND